MNFVTKITAFIVPICLVVCVGALIYAFIRTRKEKKKRRAQLGYDALTVSQSVNHIKTKARKLRRLFRIPLGLAMCYDDINKDSSTKYVHLLNKLQRKYLKRKKYYKKRVQLDYCSSNEIYDLVGKWFYKHPKEKAHQHIDTTKVWGLKDYEEKKED